MFWKSVASALVAGATPLLAFQLGDLWSSKPLSPGSTGVPAPIVDVGYTKYQGYYNSTFDINVYKGVRYAAPPKRWQLPQPPERHPEIVSQAVDDPPRCPQSPLPGMSNPQNWAGNEDCLFLNIFSPVNAEKLPVLFWIHGGGYGAGSAASFDFSNMAKTAGNGFVSVVIQYRLGAFGFASSQEIFQKGVPNAGIHDMHFALEWVQQNIAQFGGDPDQVTIAGESAGGGSVMLLAMANGGEDGTRLFRRAIASSPYLPTQPNYNDGLPEEYYHQLADRAGCKGAKDTWFDCLSNVGSPILQNASAGTTFGAKYGNWAFIPVTDGGLIVERPTEQLLKGQVNGERIITGNNANEGTYFVPQNITTEAQFKAFLRLDYPYLSADNITAIMKLYSLTGNTTAASPKFDSDGLNAPYATETSHAAVGWQQAANNLYAETTFVCPAYWLADAYSAPVNPNAKGKAAWRYQFSVTDAFHGTDIAPLMNDPATAGTKMDRVFRDSFRSIWTRFIIHGDPTLASAAGGTPGDNVAAAAAASWAPWGTVGKYAGGKGSGYPLLNLNVTGVAPEAANLQVVDGVAWEGGRGDRCALWASLGANIQQ